MGAAAQVAHAVANTQAANGDAASKKKSAALPANPLWQRMAVGPANGITASPVGAAANTPPPPPPRTPAIQRKCNACEGERDEEDEASTVQAKRIGPASDAFEREADAVADRVVQTTGPPAGRGVGVISNVMAPRVAQRMPLGVPWVQRECAACEEEEEELPEELDVIDAPGAGEPLSESLRGRIEPVLGADLSAVRVHSDARSQDAADAIGARAFTYGSDIFLGAGESSEDVGLMAHESTHVAQQGAAPLLGVEAARESGAPAERRSYGPQAEGHREGSAGVLAHEGGGADAAAEPAADRRERYADGRNPGQDTSGVAAEDEPAPESEDGGAAEDGDSRTSLADDATQAAVPAEQSAAGIQAAPESPLKSAAIAEMERIDDDCAATEGAVIESRDLARCSVRAQVAGVRAGIREFVEGNITSLTSFFAGRRTQVMSLAMGALTAAQSFVTTTIEHARAAVTSFTHTVETIATGAIESAKQSVTGIIEGINDVVNGIPLPEVPGISTVRDFLAGMISAAGAAVNGVLGAASLLVRTAVAAAGSLASSLLGMLGSALNAVLSTLSRVIATILSTLFQLFDRILSAVAKGLRRVVYGLIFPAIRQLESAVMRQIGRFASFLITQVRRNRAVHLQALADSLGGNAGMAAPEADAESIESIREIGRGAATTNRLIVEASAGNLFALFALFVASLTTAMTGVMARIAAFVAPAFEWVEEGAGKVVAAIGTVLTAVCDFISGLWQQFVTAIDSIVQWTRELVVAPIDALVTFGATLLQQLWTAAANAVSQFITGGRMASAQPTAFVPRAAPPAPAAARAPVTAAGLPAVAIVAVEVLLELAAASVLILVVAIEFAITYWWVIAIVVAIILLILLWLLIDWLIRTRPRKRKCPPCLVFTQTLIPAPNGTPGGRQEVGVNEEVRMMTLWRATWSARCGTIAPDTGSGRSSATSGIIAPDPGRGTNIIRTAPITAGECEVTATPANPECKPCSVTMKVVAPERRSLSNPPRDLEYALELAGSGFEANVTILPLNVSFARLETQQQSAVAAATGYYHNELAWNGREYARGEWTQIDRNNIARTDTVGTDPPGTAGTFANGTCRWSIPQHYRPARGAGGIEYSVAEHTQEMTERNAAKQVAQETTTKEGASRTRVPMRAVRENPLTRATANDLEELAPHLNETEDEPVGSVSLHNVSSVAGIHMLTEYLVAGKPGGTDPEEQGELLGFEKLPTFEAFRRRDGSGRGGYQQTQVFIRGHLLNNGFGGPGTARNMYPITGEANRRHRLDIERYVQGMLDGGLVVRYQVDVTPTTPATWIRVFGDDTCRYQHVGAVFVCHYCTYRLFNDGTWEANPPPRSIPSVVSTFDVAGFMALVSHPDRGCYEMDH